MVDRRIPVPVARRGIFPASERPRGLPHMYRGRVRGRLTDLFDDDHAEPRQEGRFRWLVTTCLAATVGAVAILVVIYGASDHKHANDGFLDVFDRMREQVDTAPTSPTLRLPGLAWAVPRSDRLVFTSGAVSTRYIIHDSIKQRRAGRDYIKPKPYTRVVARLTTAAPNFAGAIPPFNPFKLYTTSQPTSSGQDAAGAAVRTDVVVRVVELLGGILPSEDGQDLDAREVAETVERAEREELPLGLEGPSPESGEDLATGEGVPVAPLPYTTEIAKAALDEEMGDDAEGSEVRVVKAGQGDTLEKLLIRSGADEWQARAMTEASANLFPANSLAPGHEVRITLAPSLTQGNGMEPVRFSVFSGKAHLITVARNGAGQFVARAADRAIEAPGARLTLADSDQAQASSVYAGMYYAGLLQAIPPKTILDIMRIHAYETDFRRHVRAGDSAEFFFDMKENAGPDDPPGELLYTSITAGGETKRFYRFRAPDGGIDFYDDTGSNSKKFLMRKPVRGSEVRLTSGYGLRFHPLLNEKRMHQGVDWAAPPGTPILAAGGGSIDEAGRKGQYGNYVRIRHANGYQTAYGHLLRIADGVRTGAKVKQGNVIGYVGSTGLSSGPHLHFEVLVNSRFVDPLSIQVPQERQLKGRELIEFNKERARIDDLMRRPPVTTASR